MPQLEGVGIFTLLNGYGLVIIMILRRVRQINIFQETGVSSSRNEMARVEG